MSKLFQDFFNYLDDFGHRDLFQNSEVLWEPLNRLETYLPQLLKQLQSENSWEKISTGVRKKNFHAREGKYKESCLILTIG